MCTCQENFSKQIKEIGLELPIALAVVDGTIQTILYIPLSRIDGKRMRKGDPNKILPAYCPWCGEKIDMKAEAKRLHEEAVIVAETTARENE